MPISIGIYTTCLSLLNTCHYVAHFLWDFFLFLFSTYYLFFRYVLLIACLLLILAYYYYNTTLLTQHFVVTIT